MTPLDFDFELPEVQIARFPLPKRDASRLLVVGATNEDHHIHALPALLRAGDLLVLNDVRVRRARLSARRATGGEVEALLVGPDEALLRPSRRLKVGERLVCGDGHLLLLQQRADGCWQVRGEPDMATLERTAGSLPIPPYLGRQAEEADAERYQTVYASERSGFAASAAPTAGLHISPELLDQLKERGWSWRGWAWRWGWAPFSRYGRSSFGRENCTRNGMICRLRPGRPSKGHGRAADGW